MHNLLQMSESSRAAFISIKKKESPKLAKKIIPRDADLFWVRFERYFEDAYLPLMQLYGDHPERKKHFAAIFNCVVDAYLARPEPLRLLDLERQITPDWFERSHMVGYVCYPQFFAGNLSDVKNKIDYLQEMGVTYLHLMSVLKPRPGKNDGGYAVMDYRAVNPQLGNMGDFDALATELNERGISLCVDLVLNHTAKEHKWAKRAMAGDEKYLKYYHTFSDRLLPDQYEKNLLEIFPDEAPGNFSFYPKMGNDGRWVWTTFYEYQWDLNYSNPEVFREMLETIFFLVDQGVDILRLDAAPFLWKRMDTNCQNQPEVFLITQIFRALLRIVAPGAILKAEAIVPPDDLLQYIGVKTTVGKQCELAYNNQLMVNMWSGLATRKANLITKAAHRAPRLLLGAAPINYIRNHDDIGWAMADEDLADIGENPAAHRQFLNEFYTGSFPDSFARGVFFQHNPETGDARICGTTASLAGLELALERGDTADIDLAIKRILLLHSIILARGGIPLIYMGDEIGLLNDDSYLQDPEKAQDSRWLQRPKMDWRKVEKRQDLQTVEGRIFSALVKMINIRKNNSVLHNFALFQPMWTDNIHVMAFGRRRHDGHLLLLANFDKHRQSVQGDLAHHAGLLGNIHDLLTNKPLATSEGRISLEPYQTLWLLGEN